MALQFSTLVANWPIIATVASGMLAFGSVRSDVAGLKTDQAAMKSDHDTVVQMHTEGTARDKRLDEMHDDIKELLRRSAENQNNGSGRAR